MIRPKLNPSAQLSIIFLLPGIVWIILSDSLLAGIARHNVSFLSHLQTYKGILFMLISALIIYFVSKKILARQVLLQQALNEERLRYRNELAQEVFNAQEAERKKLGEELHDNINQLLGVVKLYIEHVQVNPEAREEMLKKSSAYLRQVIDEIRGLSKSLISPTLADLGLIESVRELVENIRQIKMIQITLHADRHLEEKLSDTQKLMVYRIVQEQLNNILKHSGAEHVEIALECSGPMAYLVIEDDGMGFDMHRKTSGLGLKNIRHRIELFNGSMKLFSEPSGGCKLEASFRV